MARVRNLLDRFSEVMSTNVAILDSVYVEDADLLRLIDVRRIWEGTELARVLYSQSRGCSASSADVPVAPALRPASVSSVIGTDGRSCWVRRMLALAARQSNHVVDPFEQAFKDLLTILNVIKQSVADNRRFVVYKPAKQRQILERIRKLPDAFRDFYSFVDAALPSHA